jgi:hypothetical protein
VYFGDVAGSLLRIISIARRCFVRCCEFVGPIAIKELTRIASAVKAFSASGDAHLPPHRQSASSANHTKLESTVRYLGIEIDDALAIAEQVDV